MLEFIGHPLYEHSLFCLFSFIFISYMISVLTCYLVFIFIIYVIIFVILFAIDNMCNFTGLCHCSKGVRRFFLFAGMKPYFSVWALLCALHNILLCITTSPVILVMLFSCIIEYFSNLSIKKLINQTNYLNRVCFLVCCSSYSFNINF